MFKLLIDYGADVFFNLNGKSLFRSVREMKQQKIKIDQQVIQYLEDKFAEKLDCISCQDIIHGYESGQRSYFSCLVQ